jgi:hypothetical protein
MRRLFVALGVCVAIAIAIASSSVNAELDNLVFTSREHRLRVVVPRGWRATDQPTYPGLILWMLRTMPDGKDGKIVLSAEPFTRKVYCSWPPECRASAESLPGKFACALRSKLTAQRIHTGAIQAGPKENEQNGMPSVWFEVDDGKRYARQAVAVREDRLVSLVLSAGSAEARSTHERAFEQALRTLRPLTPEELGQPLPAPESVVMQLVTDGGVPADAAASDAGVAGPATFALAPAAKIDPVGPCAKQ